MNNRRKIQVDEEKLKKMMAGDIPMKADPVNDIIFLDENPENQNKIEEPAKKEKKQIADTEPKEKGSPGKTAIENAEPDEIVRNSKRKKSKESYEETFLGKPVSTPFKQLTVRLDETNYKYIQKLLITSKGLSISNFINNVLAQHFECYEEDIMDLRRTFIDNYK
ncbi:DUF3408 domain-containing protein [Dysgonomonas sp. ZJ709]|uniref:DUF3408 domain-containing protein n=1 Tax=Dysgonomonas sp. ZJ709 TaxID=2709797 RepID=UPI0013ED6FCA|nr:DUF3408 domain-containing protein [Dysgonomonas sp. ZJ709]